MHLPVAEMVVAAVAELVAELVAAVVVLAVVVLAVVTSLNRPCPQVSMSFLNYSPVSSRFPPLRLALC